MSRLIDADDLFRRLGEVTPTHAELEAVRQTVLKWPECDDSELVQEVRRRGIIVDATTGGRMVDGRKLREWISYNFISYIDRKSLDLCKAILLHISEMEEKQMAGEKEVTPEPTKMSGFEALVNLRFEKQEGYIREQESRLSKMEEALNQHLVGSRDLVKRMGFIESKWAYLNFQVPPLSSPVEVTGVLSSPASGLGASALEGGQAPSGSAHASVLGDSDQATTDPSREHTYRYHHDFSGIAGQHQTIVFIVPGLDEWPKNGLLLKDGKAIPVGSAGMIQTSDGPVWLTNDPANPPLSKPMIGTSVLADGTEIRRYHTNNFKMDFDPKASPQNVGFEIALAYAKAGRRIIMGPQEEWGSGYLYVDDKGEFIHLDGQGKKFTATIYHDWATANNWCVLPDTEQP